MIIKDAEKRYGKEMAREIWANFDLSRLRVLDTIEGLDIDEFEW